MKEHLVETERRTNFKSKQRCMDVMNGVSLCVFELDFNVPALLTSPFPGFITSAVGPKKALPPLSPAGRCLKC